MIWTLIGIPVGIILLYFGSEWLVSGAKRIALSLGVSPFVIGLTVVAIGSSSPEAITSIVSSSNPEIIIGNIVGSNIANIGLAIGLAAVLSPLVCKFSTIKFEMGSMLMAVFIIALLSLCGSLGFLQGVFLIAALFAFIYAVYRFKVKTGNIDEEEPEEEDSPAEHPILESILLAVIGIFLLYGGAKFFVSGAVELAHIVGVSDLFIGIIVVSIGTALPELCICLVASYRGENDLAVSNIVGSIIFNSFFALGAGALFANVPVSGCVMWFHIPVMVAICLLAYAMIRRNGGIGRAGGTMLVSMYAAYVTLMFLFPWLTSGIS